MSDHPVENRIDIVIATDGPGSSGSSSHSPVDMPDAGAPRGRQRDSRGRFAPDSPGDKLAEFIRKMDAKQAEANRKAQATNKAMMDAYNASNPVNGPNPPGPTPGPAPQPHPDDPPAHMWPHVKDAGLRRRYWRDRRRIMNRSFAMEDRSSRQSGDVPASFQPNVTDPGQRQENYRNYQREKKREEADKRREQRESERSTEATQRRMESLEKARRAERAKEMVDRVRTFGSFGRSWGSSIGAGLGARMGGPWGAAAGSYFGGALGNTVGTYLGRMSAGSVGRLAMAGGPAAAGIVSAYAAYKVYDLAHKSFNKVIADGLIPFGAGLTKLVPILGNFIGTIEAVNKRFERDRATYIGVSPQLQVTERINSVRTMLNRIGIVNDRGWGGQSLNGQLSQMSRISNRYSMAGEKIEGGISRAVYNSAIPRLDKLVSIIEKIAENSDAIEAFTSTLIENAAGAIKLTLETMMQAMAPTGTVGALAGLFDGVFGTSASGAGKTLEELSGLINEFKREMAKDKAKKNDEMMKNAGRIFQNMDLLLHGMQGPNNPNGAPIHPNDKKSLEDMFGGLGGFPKPK